MNLIKSQISFDLPRSAIAIHLAVAGLAAVGMLTLIPPSGGGQQALIAAPVLTVLLAGVLVLRMRETVDQARKEAGSSTATDPLTGVATAAAGEQVLRMEFAAAERDRERVLTIVLIRVEQLDRYRAEHGQVVTDKLLKETGSVLNQHRRSMHLAARSAREPGTFLSILSGVDRDGATIYATRVRRDLLRLQSAPRPVGISVGIATYDMSMRSARDLVRKAAFALKKGAAAGGKVVVVGQVEDQAAASIGWPPE